ncbi:CRISPR-associated protein Cas1 [Kytococcus schroeteri]|uniref:CRISPR-associated endonuclease Cas1 n=1 Tax=Kytococcus schroeteri TaxID=138300 RepID=A0A2I1PAC1_9MICO|nr:CRISPR-associated endonuclease Cas4/Cas1 [Kytococcus schroeteri]PKZ41573.1 CRISPR-associated protein Cas1 [Kytococcus schroeteri]
MEDQPELLPARMLNEHVYCPRLFYLEWVNREWASNDDTDLGDAEHRATDRRGGRMPEPSDPAPPQRTAQVRVESEELGLAAVIDRVDHADGSCSPLDVKKGRAPDDADAWPADRVQVFAQAALLEHAGYTVREARLSYRGGGGVVSLLWGEAEREELHAAVQAARATASQLQAPLPLVDSPKCVRCSLAGLCMPDEVNALLGRSDLPPRRIVPRAPDQRPLYVTIPGARVGVSGGRLVVTLNGEPLSSARLEDVSHVAVFGNVQVSTQAMTALWKRGQVILWLSRGGWLNGWSQPPMGKHVELRRKQVHAHAQGVSEAARMIRGKVRNQRTLLRRSAKAAPPAEVLRALRTLADSALDATTREELLGIEGTAARLYFEHFARMVVPDHPWAGEFEQNGRQRRPAPDPINALLGFTYSLLAKELTVACLGVGLDPYLGVLHRSRYGRPSLALDLAEEFRPLIADSVVLQVVNNREVGETAVRRGPLGVTLTQDGRRAVLRAFERRLESEVTHPVFGYRISYRRVLDVQVRMLAGVFLGELREYVPMETR